MSDVEQLAEIKARRQKITRSPWHIEMHYDDVIDDMQPIICAPNPVGTPRNGIAEVFFGDRVLDDAEFIAAAPADVDWLLAEVERLTVENKRLSDAYEDMSWFSDEREKTRNAALSAAEARVETLQRQVEDDRMQFARETRITSAAFSATQHRALQSPREIVGEALAGWDDAMRVVERCMRLACDEGYGFIETDVSREIAREKSMGYTSVDGGRAARVARTAVPGMPQPTEEDPK